MPDTAMAKALRAHEKYLTEIGAWLQWLGRGNRAEKALLLEIIRATIERRKPGGVWAEAGDIPDSSALESKVRDSLFEKQVRFSRRKIEARAKELIKVLESPGFLGELVELYKKDETTGQDMADVAVQYQACLIEGLAYSEAGRTYLDTTCLEALQSSQDGSTTTAEGKPVPAFHLHWLEAYPGNFLDEAAATADEAVAIAGGAASAYAKLFCDLLPHFLKKEVLVVEVTVQTIIRTSSIFISKFYGKDILDDIAEVSAFAEITTVEQFTILVTKVESKIPTILGKLKTAGKWLERATFLLNAFVILKNLYNDPTDVLNFYNASKLAAYTLSGLTQWRTALWEKANPDFSKAVLKTTCVTALKRVLAVTSAMDAMLSVKNAIFAVELEDHSVTAGHVLEAAGAVATLIATTLLTGGIALIVGAAAAFLTVGGTLLVVLTKDPPLKFWFDYNFFGKEWAGAEGSACKMQVLRWNDKLGMLVHDISHQLTVYLTMFYPLRLSVTKMPVDAVSVEIKPVLLERPSDSQQSIDPPNWQVTVKALNEKGKPIEQHKVPIGEKVPSDKPPGWLWGCNSSQVEEDKKIRLVWKCEINTSLPELEGIHYIEVDVDLGKDPAHQAEMFREMASERSELKEHFPSVLRECKSKSEWN